MAQPHVRSENSVNIHMWLPRACGAGLSAQKMNRHICNERHASAQAPAQSYDAPCAYCTSVSCTHLTVHGSEGRTATTDKSKMC